MSTTYGKPFEVMIARMNYHTATADPVRMLDGYKWFEKPLEHQDGQQDFPCVQLFLPDVIETYRAAAFGQGVIACKITISVSRESSLVELMDALSKVMNAIETGTDGQRNVGLLGALQSPIEFRTANAFSTPTSLTVEVTMTMTPRVFERGAR